MIDANNDQKRITLKFLMRFMIDANNDQKRITLKFLITKHELIHFMKIFE